MPKLVDHGERRRSIISETWKLIADRGIDRLNMRDVAAASSYATPAALKHYFSSKEELLAAAYQLVCDRTNERIAFAVLGRSGLDALRLMCREIVPADPLTRTEARVAVAFWQRAQNSDELREIGRRTLFGWKQKIIGLLDDAEQKGDLRSPAAHAEIADELLATMMGLHVTSMLDPDTITGEHQRTMVDRRIDALHAGS